VKKIAVRLLAALEITCNCYFGFLDLEIDSHLLYLLIYILHTDQQPDLMIQIHWQPAVLHDRQSCLNIQRLRTYMQVLASH
jgi:hypothetical protein